MFGGKFVDDEARCHCAKKAGEARSEFVRQDAENWDAEPVAEDRFFEPGDAVEGWRDPVASAEHIHADGPIEAFVKIG